MNKTQLLDSILRTDKPLELVQEIVIKRRKRRTKPKNRKRSILAKKIAKNPAVKRARSKALKKFYKSAAGKALAKARGKFVAKIR